MVLFNQHSLISEMARSTGGAAFYNDNGLRQITSQVITDDASYYTLTYSPDNLHLDQKWHKLKVTIDGGAYNLGYRQGYFDDGVNNAAKLPKRQSRTLLKSDTRAVQVPDN